MSRWIRPALFYVAVVALATFAFQGCEVNSVEFPDLTGISTARYILRLEIVPDSIDINDVGTATAKLRAILRDWTGASLVNKTIFFEVQDFAVAFSGQVDVVTTTTETETIYNCDLDCVTGCTQVAVNPLGTSVQTQSNVAVSCEGVLNGEVFGRISPRYVKTDASGLAVSSFLPFGSFKVRQSIQSDLSDEVLDCTATQLNISTGTEVDRAEETIDTDADSVDDTCQVTETVTETTVTVTIIAFGLPNGFQLPIRATWIETDYPGQVADQNILEVHFPQWNND